MPTPEEKPKHKTREFPFNIGADPEFSIIIQGRKVHAHDFIEEVFQEEVNQNIHAVEVKNSKRELGELGWDGCDRTCEIRPKPAKTPEDLTENIGGIIAKLMSKVKIIEMTTLSTHGSIGGHIHFELPERLRAGNIKNKKIVNNIHKIMAGFYLPLMFNENKANILIRIKSNYGGMTDYRENGMTYEFRIPTAEWLISPKICNATIAYLGTVYQEILNKMDDPKFIKSVKGLTYQTETQAMALQNIALSDFEPISESIVDMIKKEIKNFEYYKDFKAEINYILSPKKVMKDKESVDHEISKGWKMCNSKIPTLKDLSSNKKIEQMVQSSDFESIAGLVNIPYNKDLRVGDYAQVLQQKILALNWKINNEYYLFGIRKGIDEYIVFNYNKELIKGKELIIKPGDVEILKSIYARIANRSIFQNINSTKDKRRCIMIGIPLKERVKNNYKNFLKVVKEIEQKTDNKGESFSHLYLESQKQESIAIDSSLKDGKPMETSKESILEPIFNKRETHNPEFKISNDEAENNRCRAQEAEQESSIISPIPLNSERISPFNLNIRDANIDNDQQVMMPNGQIYDYGWIKDNVNGWERVNFYTVDYSNYSYKVNCHCGESLSFEYEESDNGETNYWFECEGCNENPEDCCCNTCSDCGNPVNDCDCCDEEENNN